jgi:hypothetical protein
MKYKGGRRRLTRHKGAGIADWFDNLPFFKKTPDEEKEVTETLQVDGENVKVTAKNKVMDKVRTLLGENGEEAPIVETPEPVEPVVEPVEPVEPTSAEELPSLSTTEPETTQNNYYDNLGNDNMDMGLNDYDMNEPSSTSSSSSEDQMGGRKKRSHKRRRHHKKSLRRSHKNGGRRRR